MSRVFGAPLLGLLLLGSLVACSSGEKAMQEVTETVSKPVARVMPKKMANGKRIETTGKVNKKLLRNAVKLGLKQVRDCYATQLEADAASAGSLQVEVKIKGKETKASEVLIEPVDNYKAEDLVNCTKEKFMSWKYPPSTDGKDWSAKWVLAFSSLSKDKMMKGKKGKKKKKRKKKKKK